MRGRVPVLLAACILFAGVSLGVPATALGAAFVWTSPPDGTVVTGPFSVGARIDSWAGLETVTVSVSGVYYPFS